jgi:hypothetical protein
VRLAALADWFLLHDRDIYRRVDHSVVRTFEGKQRVLRRSRGYVPQAIDSGMDVPEILACAAELKKTFCLSKGRYAVLSQHIGDMENYETLMFFEKALANLKKLFRVEPRAVAYDFASGIFEHAVCSGRAGFAATLRAASSCAHRDLHGGARPSRQGDRGGFRRYPDTAPRARSGAAKCWWRITLGSSGARNCGTLLWRAGMRR